MRAVDLRFLLLADAAIVREFGKMDILGAGIKTIFTPGVPAVQATLTVAAWLDMTLDEASAQHEVEIQITGPDGQPIAGGRGMVPPASAAQLGGVPDNQLIGVPLPLPLPNIALPTWGRYTLHLRWDGESIGELPLDVVEGPPPGPSG
jgi:hypothetical protein